MCREVREDAAESWTGNSEEEEEEEEEAALCCWEVEFVSLLFVTITEDVFFWSSEWGEETEDAFWTGPPSLTHEGHSADRFWTEAVDADALDGDLDSFIEDKEANEFLLKDLSTAESKEDVEQDIKEVCSESGAGVQEAEAVRREGGLSEGCLWSFSCGGEQEDAAGGDVVGGSGWAAGEDGGEVWDSSFFSEECEDKDSWLPIGVLELLLNVSPDGGQEVKSYKLTERQKQQPGRWAESCSGALTVYSFVPHFWDKWSEELLSFILWSETNKKHE